MADFFISGRIVDLIIGFMVIEALGLVAYRMIFRAGISAIDTFVLLAPGLALLLALRSALTGEHWTVIALWLLASLAAHLVDLWRRLAASRPAPASAGDPIPAAVVSSAATKRRQEESFPHSG